MTHPTESMRAELAAILDGFLDGWYAFDAARAFAAFEPGAPGFVYQPMDRDQPVSDPAAYLHEVRTQRIAAFRELRWTNIEFDRLGDCIWVYVDLIRHTVDHSQAESRGAFRASLFLVDKDGSWRIVHYHESAQPYRQQPRVAGARPPARAAQRKASSDTLAALEHARILRETRRPRDPQAAAVAMLETFIAGWEAFDVDLAYSWWDEDYPRTLYLALEIASPIRRWCDIRTYREWQLEDRLATGTRWDWRTPLAPEDRRIQQPGEDLLLVYSALHARGLPPEAPEPDPAQVPYFTYRVSWLLRRSAGDWKIVHYHESRPTPDATPVLALGLHPSGLPGHP